MGTKLIRKLKGLNKGELIWSYEEVSVMQQEYFLREECLCEAPDAKVILSNERQDESSVDGETVDYSHVHEVQHYVFTVKY